VKTRRLTAIFVFAAGLTAASCGGDDDRALSRVFTAPPWTGDERNTYRLVDEGGDLYGTCVLETDVDAEPGKTRLNRLCANEPLYRDDGTVLAESGTLVPIESSRTRSDAENDKRVVLTSRYDPPLVRFEFDENGDVRRTERELPQPDVRSPEPGYYDDESLLWLVRGIRLEEGYQGAYANVSAATGQTFTVGVRVEGIETVKVPAGEFRAWKVRITAAAATQYAWVEAEGAHRLVRARIAGIEDVIYELTGSE
jgi:hypothetical protein